MADAATLYDDMGGAAALQPIIDDFVERVCGDAMIGFFFARVDRAQLKRLEAQFAARALGADVAYEGRPLRQAHASHRIADGQFARRRELLRQTLRDHGASQAVIDTLLAHTERLRPVVTMTGGPVCHPSQTGSGDDPRGLAALVTEVDANGQATVLDWP